jgi:hypothetical protein
MAINSLLDESAVVSQGVCLDQISIDWPFDAFLVIYINSFTLH